MFNPRRNRKEPCVFWQGKALGVSFMPGNIRINSKPLRPEFVTGHESEKKFFFFSRFHVCSLN